MLQSIDIVVDYSFSELLDRRALHRIRVRRKSEKVRRTEWRIWCLMLFDSKWKQKNKKTRKNKRFTGFWFLL